MVLGDAIPKSHTFKTSTITAFFGWGWDLTLPPFIFFVNRINVYLRQVFKVNPLRRFSSIINMTIPRDYSLVPVKGEPNTALLSVILLFGTFFVAFYMQKVRYSHFFGKQV
jgi:hypothetical protein